MVVVVARVPVGVGVAVGVVVAVVSAIVVVIVGPWGSGRRMASLAQSGSA